MPNPVPVAEYDDATFCVVPILTLRVHEAPLTLTLSPEYRGEGNCIAETI